MNNYYHTLGIQSNCTDEELKAAYRKLAMQHHPDRGGDQEQFKQVQQAYDAVLAQRSGSSTDQQYNFSNTGDLHNFFNKRSGFDWGNGDVLKNPDIHVQVPCSLLEAHTGFSKTVEFALPTGQTKYMTVQFPSGTTKDVKIRFVGQGGIFIQNAPPGDLYAAAIIHPDPLWQSDGSTLNAKIKISVWQAMFGTTIELNDVDGTLLSIAIPPGSQSGSKLRLKNKGMHIRSTQQRAHAYVELIIQIPALTADDWNMTMIDIAGKK